jgi:hypothetical protein
MKKAKKPFMVSESPELKKKGKAVRAPRKKRGK